MQPDTVEFIGLYLIPGEGTIAALREASQTKLYDKRGLEWKIVEKKKIGVDTSVEEKALSLVNHSEDSGQNLY